MHDLARTRRLAQRLRDGKASAGDQANAAHFVESWCDRWEREQLEQAGQLRLIG